MIRSWLRVLRKLLLIQRREATICVCYRLRGFEKIYLHLHLSSIFCPVFNLLSLPLIFCVNHLEERFLLYEKIFFLNLSSALDEPLHLTWLKKLSAISRANILLLFFFWIWFMTAPRNAPRSEVIREGAMNYSCPTMRLELTLKKKCWWMIRFFETKTVQLQLDASRNGDNFFVSWLLEALMTWVHSINFIARAWQNEFRSRWSEIQSCDVMTHLKWNKFSKRIFKVRSKCQNKSGRRFKDLLHASSSSRGNFSLFLSTFLFFLLSPSTFLFIRTSNKNIFHSFDDTVKLRWNHKVASAIFNNRLI